MEQIKNPVPNLRKERKALKQYERITNVAYYQEKLTIEELRRLNKYYKKTYYDICEELSRMYSKYGVNGKLDYADMLNYGRLKDINTQIEGLVNAIGEEELKLCETMFPNIYKNVYTQTGKVMDIDINFSDLPRDRVTRAIKNNWSGARFSERIWKNKAKLIDNAEETLVRGIIRGDSITTMANEFQNVMNSGEYVSRRLIRTEAIRITNQSQQDLYNDSGVKVYEYFATKDERMCPTCGGNHEKKFLKEKFPLIPVHPNCRCCTLPVLGDEATEFMKKVSDEEFEEWEKEREKERLQRKKEKEEKEKTGKEKYNRDKIEEGLNSIKVFNKDEMGKVLSVYDKCPSELKPLFGSVDKIKFIKERKKGTAFYSPYTSELHFGKGIYTVDSVFYHEYSHFLRKEGLENALRVKAISNNIPIDTYEDYFGDKLIPRLRKAFELDRKNFYLKDDSVRRKIETYVNGFRTNDSILEDLKAGVSDCYSAISKNKMYVTFGHPTSYWNRANKCMEFEEVFANYLPALMMDKTGENLKYYRDDFPNTIKICDEIIEILLEYYTNF